VRKKSESLTYIKAFFPRPVILDKKGTVRENRAGGVVMAELCIAVLGATWFLIVVTTMFGKQDETHHR
jgi:hypothetical protein